MINSKKGKASSLTREEYLSFREQSIKAKSRIREIFGGKDRIILPLSGDYMRDASERDLTEKVKEAAKEIIGFNKEFLEISMLIRESDLLENKSKSGMKFTKALKRDYNLEEAKADEIILRYSQIKNSFVDMKGFLVISVHPFDFIMMGKGRNFHTCYKPGGEYHTGSYATALDSNTFLTYVVTSIDEDYWDGSLSLNKIYRRLGVFINDFEGVKLSVQYPYESESIESASIKAISPLLGKKVEVHHNDNTQKVYAKRNAQMFNDFVKGRVKNFLYLGSIKEDSISYYGKPVKCLKCSEKLAGFSEPICFDCYVSDLMEIKEKEGEK